MGGGLEEAEQGGECKEKGEAEQGGDCTVVQQGGECVVDAEQEEGWMSCLTFHHISLMKQ